MCYDEGILQAFIDGELGREKENEIRVHLETCTTCAQLVGELKDLNDFARSKLAVDFNPGEEHIKKRFEYVMMRKGVSDLVRKYGKAVAGFAAALLVSSTLWFAPVRDAAADFLSIFRVSKIQAVKITLEDLEHIKQQLNGRGIRDIDLKQYGKVKATGGGFEKVKPEDIGLLPEKVGFNFRPLKAPGGFELTFAGLEKPMRIEITPNVVNMNRLISALGGTKLLPEELDGKTLVVNTKGAVRQNFIQNSDKREDARSFSLTQMGAPDIQVPEGVDLEAVRQAVLALPFLPDNLREQLYGIEDWKTTVPLPIPTEEVDAEEITINGKPGLSMKKSWGDNAIIWIDGETIFNIEGNLSPQELLQIANFLR
ncbi:DUF4367 domain-containing protein [Thermosediminibacter litoriperuensis]|uniref:Putative zinc finger protein n=1 Tax=Thermosediminibacter litoriperuensis TaxID=291989 RepID=A0A5S5AXU3_9FIRM|nr:DUF4367 domain-containing protein [Thermosediminibacter litoriperuensis]TYP56719.1 putative zinc finger protein [Thermosediminibacter litoriperuensis]